MGIAEATFAIAVLAILWSFYRAHRNPGVDFNLLDLIMVNGRVSKTSAVFMGSWAAMTWIIVQLTLAGKITDVFYSAYGAIFVTPIVARMFSGAAPADPKDGP